MKVFLGGALGLSIVLSACEPHTPAMSDDEIAMVRETYPMIKERCIDEARREGPAMLNVPVNKCFPMEEAERWSGLWVNEFEGSRFCAEPATECEYSEDNRNTWLSFVEGEMPSGMDIYGGGRAYSVEFIGRRTLHSSYYGHGGNFEHEIVVDNLLAIEPLE